MSEVGANQPQPIQRKEHRSAEGHILKPSKVRSFATALSGTISRFFGTAQTSPEVPGMTPYIDDMKERINAKKGMDMNAGIPIEGQEPPAVSNDVLDEFAGKADSSPLNDIPDPKIYDWGKDPAVAGQPKPFDWKKDEDLVTEQQPTPTNPPDLKIVK